MKSSTKILAGLLTVLLSGCTGQQGAVGPAGPQGPGVGTYTVTFQDGVSPSGYSATDANSPEESTPNTTYSGSLQVLAGYNSNYPTRALIRFSINPYIPLNATVVSAVLELHFLSAIMGTNPGNQAIGVYDMDLSGMASCAWTTGATWNTYDGSNAWGNCLGSGPFTYGVNFNPTPMDSVSFNGATSLPGLYAWNLKPAMVQKWVTGVSNMGVVLAIPTESTTLGSSYVFFAFAPPGSGSVYARPTLIVRYTVP